MCWPPDCRLVAPVPCESNQAGTNGAASRHPSDRGVTGQNGRRHCPRERVTRRNYLPSRPKPADDLPWCCVQEPDRTSDRVPRNLDSHVQATGPSPMGLRKPSKAARAKSSAKQLEQRAAQRSGMIWARIRGVTRRVPFGPITHHGQGGLCAVEAKGGAAAAAPSPSVGGMKRPPRKRGVVRALPGVGTSGVGTS